MNHGLQYCPVGASEMYKPERDLAGQGPHLLNMAIQSLDGQWHEPWFRDMLLKYNVSNQELCEAILAFGRMANCVIESPDAGDAAARSGFDKFSPAVQCAIYTRLGQVFFAAFQTAVKEVSTPLSLPPKPVQELAEVAATAARRYAVKMGRPDV